jgi:uncharacterized protein with HEPN domain
MTSKGRHFRLYLEDIDCEMIWEIIISDLPQNLLDLKEILKKE